MSYHWTETADEIASLGPKADALELAGCRDLGDAVERCDDEAANFYSVYFHFPHHWENDPNGLAGAICIADRDTLEDAKAYADELASRYGLKVNNFAE